MNNIHELVTGIRYTSDLIVEKGSSISAAISGFVVTTDADTIPKITISHCDTADGTFIDLDDKYAVESILKTDDKTEIMIAEEIYKLNLDLIMAKKFIKLTIAFENTTTGAATTADWQTVLLLDAIPVSLNS